MDAQENCASFAVHPLHSSLSSVTTLVNMSFKKRINFDAHYHELEIWVRGLSR